MPRLSIIICRPILSWNWILLWIFLDYNVWHFRFIDFDGVKVQFSCQTAGDESLIDVVRTICSNLSCSGNLISIKQAACAGCVAFWTVCRLEEEEFYFFNFKTCNCFFFNLEPNFQHTKYIAVSDCSQKKLT